MFISLPILLILVILYYSEKNEVIPPYTPRDSYGDEQVNDVLVAYRKAALAKAQADCDSLLREWQERTGRGQNVSAVAFELKAAKTKRDRLAQNLEGK